MIPGFVFPVHVNAAFGTYPISFYHFEWRKKVVRVPVPLSKNEMKFISPEKNSWRTGIHVFRYLAYFLFFLIPLDGPLFSQGREHARPDSPWNAMVGIEFSGGEIREELTRFAKNQKLHFFLDRRVDPGLVLQIRVPLSPIGDVFSELARSVELEFCEIGHIAYFGPPGSVAKLQGSRFLIRERMEELSLKTQLAFQQPIALKIRKLETPREILLKLADRMKISILNPEVIPHDHWPELDFSNIRGCDLLSLLLVGFDATYEISRDGTRIRIVPIPVNITERFPMESVFAPDSKDRKTPPSASKSRESAGKEKRLAGEFKNAKISDILKKLADSQGLELKIDSETLAKKGISLEQTLTLKFQDKTTEQLIRQVLNPIGCVHKIESDRIIITAK